MRTIFLALTIALIAASCQAGKSSVRGLQEDTYECILVEMAEDFEGDTSIYEHMCHGPDQWGDFDNTYHLDDNYGVIDTILEVNGVDLFAESGRFKIVLTKVMISESHAAITLSGDTTAQLIDLGISSSRRRLGQTTGNRKVAVFSVSETGSSNVVSFSGSELTSKWTGGGENSLAGRYAACSKNKLTFSAAIGNSLVDGFDEIEISTPISGASATAIQNTVWQAIRAKHGINRRSYEHVVIVLPSGTQIGGQSGWLAYAEVSNSISVFNNANAMYISNQVHEIGHNLGLRHSGEGSLSYGDQSGVMGYGHAQQNTPRQCFNAAKTWQLGWFDDQSKTVTPSSTAFTAYLDASVDYSSGLPSDEFVLFKVGTSYIGYNRKKGINDGVRANGDKVTVQTMSAEGQESWNAAALSAGGTHQIGSATVEVCEFLEVGGVSKAKISIYTGASGCSANLEPTPPPTSVPITTAPVASPVGAAPVASESSPVAIGDDTEITTTPAPVSAPTNQPTRPQTNQPISGDANSPTPNPTLAPIPAPTNAPVDPTPAPISPTNAPITPDVCPDGDMKISLVLKTDNKPNETSWELLEYRGEVIDFVDGYTQKLRQYEYEYCVDQYSTYEFRLKDSGRDGISSTENGQGFYTIEINGEVYSQGGMFASEEIDYIVEPCSYTDDESQRYKNFQFIFATGDDPADISWNLDPSPYQGGPWVGRNSSIHWVENMCLDSETCYTLTMNSASGNGFAGESGYYEVSFDLENVAFSTFGSGYEETVQFGGCKEASIGSP